MMTHCQSCGEQLTRAEQMAITRAAHAHVKTAEDMREHYRTGEHLRTPGLCEACRRKQA